MHRIIHELVAAAGGILFLIFGISRQRERKKLIKAGIKTERPILWNLFIIVGIGLIVFALGLLIFNLNHPPIK